MVEGTPPRARLEPRRLDLQRAAQHVDACRWRGSRRSRDCHDGGEREGAGAAGDGGRGGQRLPRYISTPIVPPGEEDADERGRHEDEREIAARRRAGADTGIDAGGRWQAPASRGQPSGRWNQGIAGPGDRGSGRRGPAVWLTRLTCRRAGGRGIVPPESPFAEPADRAPGVRLAETR